MAQALILAGSRTGGDPLAAAAGVTHKGLIEVAGRTMLERVANALTCAGFEKIAVSTGSGPLADLAVALDLHIIAAEDGPSRSVAAALEQLGAPLLVTTVDHALLAPSWIDAFIGGVPDGVDLAALLARRETIEREVPGSRRTYFRFADGEWSGCNLFYLATPRARTGLALWTDVEADRKRPWRIVRRLGVRQLLRYVFGTLTLAEGVAHLGALAGIKATAVETPFGLAAVDVDTVADLAAVRALADPNNVDAKLFRLVEVRGRIADAEDGESVPAGRERLDRLYQELAVAEARLSPEGLRTAAARGDPLAMVELMSRGLPPE